jgi:excisionase family DNA binding protein
MIFTGRTMDLLTTSEMAEKWNISRRRVTTLCQEGRIKGAILKGNTWLIPEGTSKPEDPRHNKVKSNQNHGDIKNESGTKSQDKSYYKKTNS